MQFGVLKSTIYIFLFEHRGWEYGKMLEMANAYCCTWNKNRVLQYMTENSACYKKDAPEVCAFCQEARKTAIGRHKKGDSGDYHCVLFVVNGNLKHHVRCRLLQAGSWPLRHLQVTPVPLIEMCGTSIFLFLHQLPCMIITFCDVAMTLMCVSMDRSRIMSHNHTFFSF